MNMEKINAAGIRLRCPQCRTDIAPAHYDKTAGLICGSCAATFPVHEHFIDFLPAASGALSTAAEYERLFSGAAEGREPVLYYGKTIHEEVEEFFGETGYHKKCLPGMKILDAGCGLVCGAAH